MSQLSLPMPAPDEATVEVAQRVRWGYAEMIWVCPHCGGEVTSRIGDGETADTIAADPACAKCRAASMGVPFRDWRRLPLSERMSHKPPAGWRRT